MADPKLETSKKTTRWAFTAYEHQYPLIEAKHDLIAEIGWQDEICPETGRKHRQGFLRTVRQVRFSQLRSLLPGLHIEQAKNWTALQKYCKKEATRDPDGSQVVKTYEPPWALHDLLQSVAFQLIQEEPLVRLDSQTDRQVLLSYLRKYSKHIVLSRPQYATVLVRQDARDAWCAYIEEWMEMARGQ